MTVTFTTETGSIYYLDGFEMTWKRILATDKSGPIRGDGGGKLLSWPVIEIGRSAVLLVEPHETSPESSIRIIKTSHVISVMCPAPLPA